MEIRENKMLNREALNKKNNKNEGFYSYKNEKENDFG